MIEWNRTSEGLPPYNIPVLVACKCGETYPEEVMFIMKRVVDEYNCDVWECLYDYDQSTIYDDDQWAYINLPKKDGDLD
jgi:hypothetical protein